MKINKIEFEESIRVKKEKLQITWTKQDLKIIMMNTTNLDLVQQQWISQLGQEIIEWPSKEE